jgi:predicted amidohydrolase YtcJ
VDLNQQLLPADWPVQQLEAEARKVYFEDLVVNPPQTPEFKWLEKRTIIIANSEGGFQKIFGESRGWASYSHQKTGNLDVQRLRRARWIRPVLEMRVPKTKIYVNNHSMKAREYNPQTRQGKKRLYVTTDTGLLYFISLVYIEHGLALSTAFEPDGQWLREMLKKHGTTMLSPLL